MAPSSRQVPPWSGRQQRGLRFALLAVIPVWLLASAVGHFAEARAPLLGGHVVAVTPFADPSAGGRLLRIDYVYSDEQGEHSAFRDLVPRAAESLGLVTPGAPLAVRIVFGEPLLRGAPNVYFGAPLGIAGCFAILVLIFFLIDRAEARRIDLVLRGILGPGMIESFSVTTVRHIETWSIRFSYDSPRGRQHATLRLAASTIEEGPLTALGVDRVPAAGDRVTVAYDAHLPRRSTIYSFDRSAELPEASADTLPLPRQLSERPRPLPAGAPRLTTEVPPAVLALLAVALLFFGAGPIVYAALAHRPGEAAEAVFVGEMMFSLLFTMTAAFLLGATVRPCRILRQGPPLAASITRVARSSARHVWISFVGRSEHGPWHGRASIRTRRLSAMNADPQPGDTIFLVADPARPWERVIWGFAAARDGSSEHGAFHAQPVDARKASG